MVSLEKGILIGVRMNNFYELVQKMETQFNEKSAIKYIDDRSGDIVSITYSQFISEIRKCVSFLMEQKKLSQNRIHFAILSKNRYEYLAFFLAAGLSNSVIVPLNYQNDTVALTEEVQRANVNLLLYDNEFRDIATMIAEKAGVNSYHINCYSAYNEAELVVPGNDEDFFLILFTSGTTSRLSKGVMHGQKNALFSAYCAIKWSQACIYSARKKRPADFHSFIPIPLFHVYALCSSLGTFLIGNTIYLGLDMKYFLRDLRKMEGHMIPAVPAMLHSIYTELKKGKQTSLVAFSIGGASCDQNELAFFIQKDYGILNAYALTESFGDGSMNIIQDSKHISSIGCKKDNPRCVISDGEFRLSGEGLMLGYYNDPIATIDAFDEEGRFCTGDLGYEDEDGYYYITGRKNNLIILSNGENINPEELEEKILICHNVKEAKVEQEKDKIIAEIYCEIKEQDNVRLYISALNRTLPLYKRISAISFRNTPFPRTALGKIIRHCE